MTFPVITIVRHIATYINRDVETYNEYFVKVIQKDFVCSDSDDDKNCCEQVNVNDNQLDNC